MWQSHEKFVLQQLNRKLSHEEAFSLLADHREKLINLQHERLIYLIVTMTVALSTVILTSVTVVISSSMFLYADIMLLILLTAYLIHYRKLENTTQQWYDLTEQIKAKLN